MLVAKEPTLKNNDFQSQSVEECNLYTLLISYKQSELNCKNNPNLKEIGKEVSQTQTFFVINQKRLL